MNKYKVKISIELVENVTIMADSKESALSLIDKEKTGIMKLTKNKHFKTIKNVEIKQI